MKSFSILNWSFEYKVTAKYLDQIGLVGYLFGTVMSIILSEMTCFTDSFMVDFKFEN